MPCHASLVDGNNADRAGFIKTGEGNSSTVYDDALGRCMGKIFDECPPQVLREEDGITAYTPKAATQPRQKPAPTCTMPPRDAHVRSWKCVLWGGEPIEGAAASGTLPLHCRNFGSSEFFLPRTIHRGSLTEPADRAFGSWVAGSTSTRRSHRRQPQVFPNTTSSIGSARRAS